MAEKKQTPVKEMQQTYTKEQLVAAKKFETRRDLLGAMLEDQKQYSIGDVEDLISKYEKGLVK